VFLNCVIRNEDEEIKAYFFMNVVFASYRVCLLVGYICCLTPVMSLAKFYVVPCYFTSLAGNRKY
jgi:hypothetical protein